MQKAINSQVVNRRPCCPTKSSTGLKKTKKKGDYERSVNKSCSRRGQSSSRDDQAIKVRDFNDSGRKLADTHSRTFEKLGGLTKITKPNNMHSLRLSVTRDLCKENKKREAHGSMRSSGMFSPQCIRNEQVLLEKTRNLEEIRTTLNEELEVLKRSEMNLLKVNESLSQQLVNAQKSLQNESERTCARDKRHHEEINQLRSEFHQERSKLLELSSKNSILQIEKDSAQREVETLQQQLLSDRQSIGELQKTISTLKHKLLQEETANTLKAKDAESSSAKIAEELSCKYIKEIGGIEQQHRDIVKKLELTHSQEVESLRGQWKQELLAKENELASLKLQLNSVNEKLSLKLRQVQASAGERELGLKHAERKLTEATEEVEQLRKKLEVLNKQKVDLAIKTENKDEAARQSQRIVEQLTSRMKQIELDKEDYYEAVLESRERIEQLHEEIKGMLEEEDEFMGRFEHIANKVVLLETHMKMDKNIRAQLEERIQHLEHSNKLLEEQANSQSAATHREREEALKQSDELKIKVVEYRGRWQAAQQKIRKLEKDVLQLQNSHRQEVSALQNKIVSAAHAKRFDREVDYANENMQQSVRTKGTYGRSTGDILSQYDANYTRD